MTDLTKLTAEDVCWWMEEVICDLTPEQKREIRRRLERLEKCEAALKPFAELASEVDRLRHPDEATCQWRLQAGDLRAARAALEEK